MPEDEPVKRGVLPGAGRPIRWVQKELGSDKTGQPSRVCDRCIQKKTRCDVKSPCCSACAETATKCTYSQMRKRPGPVKGTHKKTRGRPTGQASSTEASPPKQQITAEIDAPQSEPLAVDLSIETFFQQMVPDTTPITFGSVAPFEPCLTPQLSDNIDELTENFALTVNQAFPLFPPGALSDQIKNGTICNALPSIILYLSVETMGVYCWRRDMNVDQALHRFTKSVAVSTETVVDPLALNQWRTACLLSWYCFQQSPSNDEVIRIAVLTRKAYQCGLHQIDSEENRASFGWDLVGQETLEDWRHVWWCIYALDCHASFLTATPHLVESDSIMTALPRTQPQPGCNWNLASPKHFLTSDWGNMWRVIEEISNAGGDKTCSLHTAVSILLKEATTLRRLHNQNPRQSIRDRMSALEDYLSAVQLALPPNYMRQSRDILHGESDVAYHRRLLTSLKIYSSRLLLRLPFPCLLDTAEWDGRWQETLEVCYQMVAIIQQWDIRCMPAVDPSIYFVTLSLLILLHLHSLSVAVPQPALYEQLTRRKDIVRLFLRNYAMYWSLPRYFLESYDVFAYKLTMPLCPQDIMLVMSQFHGPLHRKWLKFLSLGPPTGSCADDYQALAASNVIPLPGAPAAGGPRPADGFRVWTI